MSSDIASTTIATPSWSCASGTAGNCAT